MGEDIKQPKKTVSVKINHYTVVIIPEEKNTESYIQKIKHRISKSGFGSMKFLQD